MGWDWFWAPDYWQARFVVQRLVAATYVLGFFNAACQFPALLGERGLTPVPRFLTATGFRGAPSLFQWHYSDRFLRFVAWTGVVLGASAFVGITDLLPLWAHMLVWSLLWGLYLSIVNVGQIWYAFGWESLLLEAGFLTIFLGPARTLPPAVVLWLLLWLLFRVEFGAGMIKMRGDVVWRDLTALYYHHETQPMPGPLSRRFHWLSRREHRIEVLANHFVQLVVPFALFAPQPVATAAGTTVIVTQLWLMVSGNFAWLNLVTIALAFAALDSTLLGWIPEPATTVPTPLWHRAAVLAVGLTIVVLSYQPVRNMLGRGQVMNRTFNKLHLGNTYGAFGSVTRVRYEVVLEGFDGREEMWREYEFKAKPGDPMRRPPQIAPYHLRLDWLMWFCAISPSYGRTWLPRLLAALLHDDERILRLLRHNPFPGAAPELVRARTFHYRFTSRDEQRATGAWWVREPVTELVPPVSPADLERV